MRRSLVGPVVYTLTIPLAFVSAIACFVVYALIALYFVAGPSSRIATPDDPTGSGESLDDAGEQPAAEIVEPTAGQRDEEPVADPVTEED